MVLAHAGATSPFQWHPHPDVWLMVVVLVGGYITALRYWAPEGSPPVSASRKLSFFLGAGILWIGADWPMHDLSEGVLFSAHMVQHLVFSLVAPPLLLLGLPPWLLRRLISPRPIEWVVRRLARPVPALLIFNAAVVLVHWPAAINLQVSSEIAHFGIHVVFVSSALLMWWPVIEPLPELGSMNPLAKMFYLFLQSIVPTVPASFLTFATTPLFDSYAGGLGMSPVTDQMVAGLIMKLGGGLLLWSVIAFIFFRWHGQEEKPRELTEMPWEDFERELDMWDLRK